MVKRESAVLTDARPLRKIDETNSDLVYWDFHDAIGHC